MKSSKVLAVLTGAVLLFSSAGLVFASPFDDIRSYRNSTDTGTTTQAVTPFATSPGSDSIELFIGNDDLSAFHSFNIGSGIGVSLGSNNIYVTPNTIETPDGFLTDTLGIINSSLSSLSGNISSLTSSMSGLSSIVSSHTTSISSINALDAQINANLFGTSTTMLASATSTTNGLMTKAQGVKLDAMASNLPWSWATTTRSIVTGTGATGFQVSSTRVSTVRYNTTVTTTASIAGNAGGYIALEVAPTNSATASDWVEMGRCGNSQALTLAITLQSVQGTTCQLAADIPVGYYAKLRSVTSQGTVSFAFVSSSEVLK